MVEFIVNEGDVEAFVVEELCYHEHGVYVALRRVWDANGMRLLHLCVCARSSYFITKANVHADKFSPSPVQNCG